MSKSIMHSRQDGTCYLCMLLHGDYDRRTGLEEHHAVPGNPGRKLSEHYGLKVYLCAQHHREGPEAAHASIGIRRLLQQEAQRAFEKSIPMTNGWASSGGIIYNMPSRLSAAYTGITVYG